MFKYLRPFQSIDMSLYHQRGVSAQKEEVHAATKGLDHGLYPSAFCKIYPDYLGNDADWINVMHADGAGTKSILAYLYWKETGDISVWRGIAQDAIVMNLDDLLCVGIYDNLVFNSTIDRNKHVIPGEVLAEIINGSQALFDTLSSYGINIHFLGGETADVGDVVRTIAVNGTLTARWPKNKLITNEHINVGDVIVGLSSYGQSTYESAYNSGIASNGLTSARHDMLNEYYAQHFPETFDPNTNKDVVYVGPYKLTDKVPIYYRGLAQELSIGHLLLSPTRTFAPVVREILMQYSEAIHGMVHCSGGGQTKCLKYIPDGVSVVKDNLIDVPEIFNFIQKAGGADLREMYQVFNMGTRLEVYTSAGVANEIISIATSYGIEAQIIGRVEASEVKAVEIRTAEGTLKF